MVRDGTEWTASDGEPGRAALGLVDGLDLHAQYYADRIGGDFFDAVRVGSRVVFLLSDIAGRRREAGPIAVRTQEVFRAKAAELFGAHDVNLMEGTELLVQAINLAIAGPAKEIHFAPTLVGCYDVQLGFARLRECRGTDGGDSGFGGHEDSSQCIDAVRSLYAFDLRRFDAGV